MKSLITIAMGVIALVLPTEHRAATVLPRPDYITHFWYDYVNIVGLTYQDLTYIKTGYETSACSFQIHEIGKNLSGSTYGAVYLYQSALNYVETDCMGVKYKPWDDKNLMERAVRDIISTLPSFPIRRNGGGLVSGQPGCKIIMWISNKGGGQWTGTIPCGEVPPVSCSLNVPSVINHRTAVAGTVRSRARGIARISCTGASTVKLKLLTPQLDLNSGGNKIVSDITLGEDGSRTAVVQADPEGAIDINSDIAVNEAPPGVFEGSTVLTASWD